MIHKFESTHTEPKTYRDYVAISDGVVFDQACKFLHDGDEKIRRVFEQYRVRTDLSRYFPSVVPPVVFVQ